MKTLFKLKSTRDYLDKLDKPMLSINAQILYQRKKRLSYRFLTEKITFEEFITRERIRIID